MEFGNYILTKRREIFKNPKRFFEASHLTCSYVSYLRVERGETLPSFSLAINILEALKADVKIGIHALIRDHIPDDRYRAIFKDFSLLPCKESLQSGDALVVNRMQADLLRKDPIYWDILTFLNAHSLERPSIERVSSDLGISVDQTATYLSDLYSYGLVDLDDRTGFYRAKDKVFVPFEFADIRDRSLKRSLDRFFRATPTERFRTVHTRCATPSQREEIVAKIEAFLDRIADIPDEGGETYSIGVFASNVRYTEERQ